MHSIIKLGWCSMTRNQNWSVFASIVLTALLVLGCSGPGASDTPDLLTSPNISTQNQKASYSDGYNPNSLWGFWWIYIDPSNNSWEIVPTRVPSMHANVREFLEDGIP